MSLVPEGFYLAVARAFPDENGIEQLAQFGRSKNGNAQVLIHFEIIEEGNDHAGVVLPWFGSFAKGAYKRTLESLRYCGWRGTDVSDLGALDQTVTVQVEHNEVEGENGPKTYARVAWVNRPGMGGGRVKLQAPMDATQLRMFAASLKDEAARIPEVSGDRASGQNGARQQYDERNPPPYGDDDNLPF